MINGSEGSRSVWNLTIAPLTYLHLNASVSADVCIVGAGIAGITTAYLLAKEGMKVVVLDSGPVGGGESGRTTAHLSYVLGQRYYDLAKVHGEDGARSILESHSGAISAIEGIIIAEGINCDFERLSGYLFLAAGERVRTLERELETLKRFNVPGVELTDGAPLPNFTTGPALEFTSQAQFNPLLYIQALAERIIKMGGSIFTDTHIKEFHSGHSVKVVADSGFDVTSDFLVVATNTPINDRLTIHTKQAAYRTYVVGARVAKGTVPRALYWDTEDPYHYARLVTPDNLEGELLIVGGCDHRTGQDPHPEHRFTLLESWMKERFFGTGPVEFRWSGQIIESMDGVGFIGRNPLDDQNVFIATGDSGNGMTNGTIAGLLITDLIRGRESPWTALYSPDRKNLRAVKSYVSENLNAAYQYKDWFKRGDVASVGEITPGCGAVLSRGLQKIAVYRDEDDITHECSAVCPHLGGIVRWNEEGKSWDCPCHGSRFDPHGTVLNGPAIKGLTPINEDSAITNEEVFVDV